ncbi:MAG: ribbon-helix-helix protein, CopG family [Acidobacteria bacterium]|nr:ribbon-helix-helix protein, CopG family [Acidobacteriota bacterium]
MARTRKTQVLLRSDEYERLEAIAAQRRTSVPDLIREAVRDRYLPLAERRKRAVEAICQLRIPIPDWDTLEKETAEGNYTEDRKEIYAGMTLEDLVSEMKRRRAERVLGSPEGTKA